jgi:hypothetical protein
MRLAAFCAAVSVSALIGLSTWAESLVEAILIFAVFALVFSHRPFVAVLARAPRFLQRGALAMAALWVWSQLHEVVIDTYPFISWRMYGEPPKHRDGAGYRLLGERCSGEEVILPPSSGSTGRRPILSLAVRRAYEESLSGVGNPARAQQRMDNLLAAILTRWNDRNPSVQLCAVSLQQSTVAIVDVAASPRANYTTVLRHDAR